MRPAGRVCAAARPAAVPPAALPTPQTRAEASCRLNHPAKPEPLDSESQFGTAPKKAPSGARFGSQRPSPWATPKHLLSQSTCLACAWQVAAALRGTRTRVPSAATAACLLHLSCDTSPCAGTHTDMCGSCLNVCVPLSLMQRTRMLPSSPARSADARARVGGAHVTRRSLVACPRCARAPWARAANSLSPPRCVHGSISSLPSTTPLPGRTPTRPRTRPSTVPRLILYLPLPLGPAPPV